MSNQKWVSHLTLAIITEEVSFNIPGDSVKNILGLSYEQIQAQQNTTGILEGLNLDEVTVNGNVKYNLTPHKINRVVEGADTIVILIHGFLESSEGSMVSKDKMRYLFLKRIIETR